MGCYGWVDDANAPISIRVYCYKCGEEIELNKHDWVKDHRDCTDNTGRVPVDIEEENVIQR